MARVLVFVIVVFLAAAGFAWLADRPGAIVLTWQGYEIRVPIPGGPVEGFAVECPRHGAKFDLRSGEALCAPAYTPIEVFPVKREDGAVWTRDDRGD